MQCNARGQHDTHQIIEIWKHTDIPQLLGQLALFTDRLDVYFLSVVIARAVERHTWPELLVASIALANDSVFLPSIGVAVDRYLCGPTSTTFILSSASSMAIA